MINAGVGISLLEDSIEAAKEASGMAMRQADIDKADWALAFCTFSHRANYEEILKTVCRVAKTSKLSGCSAIGVLSNGGEVEAKPGITVLTVSSSDIHARPFMTHQLGEAGIKAGEEIGGMLKCPGKGSSLLTLLPDPFHIHPELLFKGVQSKLGNIDIVGASASEDPRINDTFGFHNQTVASEAVSGIHMSGDFSYTIDITQGCKLVGPPSVITKADKNLIIELDGQPAYDVLKKRVPAGFLDNPSELMRLLFIAFPPNSHLNEIIGGDYLVRNLMGFDPKTGVIGIAQNVREGQLISFTMRNPETARQDLKDMLERVSAREDPDNPYRFGLYFNCCARGSSLYGHEGIDTAYINSALGDVPIAGFFGNSEFGPVQGANYLFTYTGVLVLFSEK